MMREPKIVRVLTYFYVVPLAAMVVFNTINSCLRTTYFELYKDMETAKYKWDNHIFLLVSESRQHTKDCLSILNLDLAMLMKLKIQIHLVMFCI